MVLLLPLLVILLLSSTFADQSLRTNEAANEQIIRKLQDGPNNQNGNQDNQQVDFNNAGSLNVEADVEDITDLFPYAPSGPVRLSALTGRWFVVYRSLFFSTNGFCTTVDYDIKARTDGSATDTQLRITVGQRSNSRTGTLQKSIGSGTNSAYGIDPIPGILYGMYATAYTRETDSLNPGIFVVQAAGAIDIQTRQYSWVVMSDPAKAFSFVMARNVDDFRSIYQNDVLDLMQANGFDKLWNQPTVEVPQGDDCLYLQPTVFV